MSSSVTGPEASVVGALKVIFFLSFHFLSVKMQLSARSTIKLQELSGESGELPCLLNMYIVNLILISEML